LGAGEGRERGPFMERITGATNSPKTGLRIPLLIPRHSRFDSYILCVSALTFQQEKQDLALVQK